MNFKAIFAIFLIIFSVSILSAQIGPPNMDYPSDKSTDISVSPLLQLKTVWDAIPEYEVDTVSTFKSPVKQHMFGLKSKKENAKPQFLYFNQKYYWRSRISLDGDTSVWSSPWSFTTIATPKIYSPADNSTQGTSELAWYTMGASLYKVELDTTPNFNSPFLQKLEVKDTLLLSGSVNFITPNRLLFGKKHYWRVKALHKNDSTGWSPTWSFSMPTKTTLRLPANNTILTNAETSLEWTEFRGAHYYHIQYDTTPNFRSAAKVDSIVLKTKISYQSLIVKDLYFGKKYYWRVRATNSGDSSQWSDSWAFTTLPALKLSSPYNSSTYVGVNEAHRWNSVTPGNNTYQLQVDSTPNFNSPHLFSGFSIIASIAPTKRLFSTKYYWRARVMNAKDTSDWSEVRTYTTYARIKPILLSPSNNSKDLAVETTFQWQGNDGVSSIFQIDTNPNFTSPIIIDTFNTLNISYPKNLIKELDFNKKYYWRARNFLDADSTDWSNPYSFTTIARPELDFPYDNMPNFGTETNILAKPMTGATHYLWELDTNANFNSPALRSGDTTDFTADPGGEFYFGKWYYWRFKAAHAKDTSEWSVTRRFQSTTTIFLFKPANNTYNVSNQPNFDWGGIAGAIGYQYLLSKDSTFTNVKPVTVWGQANTKHVIPVSYGSYYYWKVRAFHAKDTSSWSERFMFKTKNMPVIPAPILNSPKNNAINVKAGQVQFFWSSNGVTATSYDFQLDYTNSFSAPVINAAKLPNAFASISNMKPAQEYFWRVRTWVDTLSSAWSAPFKFTTEIISGLNEDLNENNSQSVSVFPNPAKGSFTIKLKNENLKLQSLSVIDLSGKTWDQRTINPIQGNELQIDISTVPAGLYLIKLQFENNFEIHKIVLE